jgi:CRP-like cAMP-binding protein
MQPEIFDMLGTNSSLVLLDIKARKQLAAISNLTIFGKGQVIYHEGTPATRVWAVVSGQVKIVKITAKGHELMIEIIVPQELFGAVYYAECPQYPCTAVAMESARVLSFPVSQMHSYLGGNGALQRRVLADTCIRLCHAQHMRGLAVEGVPQRIGGALVYLFEKFGSNIPHTRATLANLAGTTVESAIRVTRKLSKNGIISTRRGSITVLAPERLEAFADDR